MNKFHGHIWTNLLSEFIGDVQTIVNLRQTMKLTRNIKGNCARKISIGAFTLEQYLDICGFVFGKSTFYVALNDIEISEKKTKNTQKSVVNIASCLKKLQENPRFGFGCGGFTMINTKLSSSAETELKMDQISPVMSNIDVNYQDPVVWVRETCQPTISDNLNVNLTQKTISCKEKHFLTLIAQHKNMVVNCDSKAQQYLFRFHSQMLNFNLTITMDDVQYAGRFIINTNADVLTLINLSRCTFIAFHSCKNLKELRIDVQGDVDVVFANVMVIYGLAPNLRKIVLLCAAGNRLPVCRELQTQLKKKLEFMDVTVV